MRIPWDRAGGRSAGLVVLVPVLVLAPVARPAGAAPPAPSAAPATAVAPLPGVEWNDPDGVNWSDAPSASRLAAEPRSVGRLLGRRGEPREADDQPRAGGRLREWLRERRLARGANGAGTPEAAPTRPDGWPEPTRLIEQLGELATAGGAPAAWATTTLGQLRAVLATAGPEDEAAEATLLTLGETVPAGMAVADTVEPALAAPTRRAALAVSRRVAVWRAATACRPILVASPDGSEEPAPGEALDGLVESLERFEASGAAADAALAGALLTRLTAAAPAAEPLRQAIDDHYRSPNVRIAVTRQFAERMLPEATVRTGPVEEFVLGRRVRGTSRVEQSTGVRFTPHTSAIRCDLLVEGEIASRTVTESGPVSLHSRARGSFTVLKPIQVSARGLTFGPAKGTASTRSQLADIETSFDAVPVMGPLVRGIARSQHDASREEARREVNDRIISRACREVDRTAEPRFAEVAQRVRERVWGPLVALGLEPTPVALETTPDQATARLRLAGRAQLAAHTPRPRAPQGALVSVQLHESVVNNACEGLGLAGRTFTVAELVALLQERLGLPPRPTDDLPDGVRVTFADEEPLRVDCRDGRVWVRVSLAALESGRRDWEHVVARVAYRPVTAGLQVLLERDGPVQISGPGHLGRMEIGLRTVFGKVFAKERPIALVPETILANPRLADVEAVQAVSADGWLALALAEGAPDEAEVRPVATARRLDGGGLLRR